MMNATAILSGNKIERACHKFRDALLEGAEPDYGGYWTKSGRLWLSIDLSQPSIYVFNLYYKWSYTKNLELNFEHSSPSKRRGGIFATAPEGTLICHSGRMWNGTAKFVRWYRKRYGESRFANVAWPDGRGSKRYIVIGRLGSPDLEKHVADYVSARYRFAHGAPRRKPRGPRPVPTVFVPGAQPRTTTMITRAAKKQMRLNHNAVVSAIARLLERKQGDKLWKDQERDLFIGEKRGPAEVLFEVKTDGNTASIYTGVGQLMLHGTRDNPPPRRILVVPDNPKPKPETVKALDRLGIRLLQFTWSNGKPRISPPALDEAME